MHIEAASYRLRPGVGLRMLGAGCLWLGLLVLLEFGRRAFTDLGGVGFTVALWVGVGLFAVVAGVGAGLLLDRRPRLVLDAEGFLNRTERGPGVRRAQWSEVADVQRAEASGGPVLLITLSDGRSSRVLARLLDARPSEVERAVRAHLDDAHGYHPLA